jgi:hypothetical protein
VGYSKRALLVTLIVTFMSFAVSIGLSRRKFAPNGILVGNNSASIAAQCRSVGRDLYPAYSKDIETESIDDKMTAQPWLEELKWGVLVDGSSSEEKPGQLGLGLAKDVRGEPRDGHYYY